MPRITGARSCFTTSEQMLIMNRRMSKWGAGLSGRWRRAVLWYLTAWRDANPTTLNEQATEKKNQVRGSKQAK